MADTKRGTEIDTKRGVKLTSQNLRLIRSVCQERQERRFLGHFQITSFPCVPASGRVAYAEHAVQTCVTELVCTAIELAQLTACSHVISLEALLVSRTYTRVTEPRIHPFSVSTSLSHAATYLPALSILLCCRLVVCHHHGTVLTLFHDYLGCIAASRNDVNALRE